MNNKTKGIARDAFGLWVSGLFKTVAGWNPELNFDQQKEEFFLVIKELLDAGKIKFIAPGADVYVSGLNPNPAFKIEDEICHWSIGSEEIVRYLRDQWPRDVEHEDGEDLVMYFFEIPSIIWVDDDGGYLAS